MKSSTPRATSKPSTRTRDRNFLAKSSSMSPEPSPPTTSSSGPRRASTAVPIRQSSRIPSPVGRASPQTRGLSPPISSSNSPSHGGERSISTTRRQTPATVKGPNSASSQPRSKQILSHDFLSKASKSRGPSMLTRSIDDPTCHQLQRHSTPLSKHQFDFMSKSHDHGSLSFYNSNDRGAKFVNKSQNQGPRSLSKSQDRGFMSKSQERGLMSKSQDKGSLSSYANQGVGARKVTVPEYGYDGRRLSTGSRDAAAQAAPRSGVVASQGATRRDFPSLHLQMGRSVDSTVSLSTTTSSPTDRARRQSFRDHNERRLKPLQLSEPVLSQGYRSGDITPEETSPLDARAPGSGLRGGTKHRQLKSPDFFDVKKLDGDGGVITAVSRMHQKSNGVAQRAETTGRGADEDQDASAHNQHLNFEQRRDLLASSARKAFSVETDSAIGSAHFSEINYKLEKELSGTQELLEIGSWNDDDDEYLRVYKFERNGEAPFVDILEDTKSDSGVAGSKSKRVEAAITSPSRAKKWAQFAKISEVGHRGGALYQKSEAGSDLGTSTQGSPLASPPRGSAVKAASITKTAAVSRISSTSATSIDLNRSTDTTCSTYSQYDNAFWGDPPVNRNFRPWNPKQEAEMAPAVVKPRPLPQLELVHAQEPSAILATRESVADVALSESRMSKYNDGLERLTSYMKTANQTARKRRGLSDDLSSQASGCFDYLVDFLESQTSITDVLVSAHDETLKHDFANSGGGNVNATAMKRLDSKLTNDTSMLSNRSIESRITDLGSEASWESGKSRSVQTMGTTGKVMDQITEKVDSLSYDSPKHLSTFKFGLKKTTVGAFETITSSDQAGVPASGNQDASAPTSKAVSERSLPKRKPVSTQVSRPQSPNLGWRSQTEPNSRNLSRSPSHRTFSDEKLAVIGHPLPSPLPTIKIVSEGGVESRREEAMSTSPPGSDEPPVSEAPSEAREAKQAKSMSLEKHSKSSTLAPPSPTVVAPLKNVKMHSRDASGDQRGPVVGSEEGATRKGIGRGVVKHDDRDSLTHSLNQANKGCGCNIL